MRKTNTQITIENTKGIEILEDLIRDPSDHVVVKKRYSAFFRTNLDEVLKQLDLDTLIIGGVNTHACVRTTIIDAYQRDFEVLLAVDCTDSYDEEHHYVSLKYLTKSISTAKTNPEIFALIGN